MTVPLTSDAILDRLDRMCSDKGTVSAAAGKPSDPMTTAQVLVLAHDIPCVGGLLADRRAAAALYLRDQQQPDGRWLRDEDDWHTSITAWAVLALSTFSNAEQDAISRGVAWLNARQTPDGGFSQSDVVDRPNTYSTSNATAALFAVTDYSQQVADGIEWVRRNQDEQGGFKDDCAVHADSDPSLTAYVAHALSRLPHSLTGSVVEGCALFIAATQRPSGAWSAWYEDADSVEGTAAALRVLMAAQEDYGKQIEAGFMFLNRTVDIDNLENWIIISLAYILLGESTDGLQYNG